MKQLLSFLFLSLCFQLHAQQAGIELYSFRNQFPKDVTGVLDKIRDLGITVVEGGDSYGMAPADFQAALKERNISVVSIGADFNLLDKDPDSVIRKAKLYGSKYVVCFWIPHKDKFGVTDLEEAVRVFNTAGKKLAEAGLSLCYHPHGYEFESYKDGTYFDALVNRIDRNNANFEMDVFWVKHLGQDPVALMKKFPNRFPLLHLKDRQKGTEGNQRGEADVETNVVLGTGDVDIAGVIRQARKNKVAYMFIEDESSRSMEQVPLSLQYIRSIK